jgi:hypothetical protein
MATFNHYYRTANSASTLPYGAVSADGAPDGTADHPWSSFTSGGGAVETLVESTASHDTDDLVLHFHPACVFNSADTTFDTWTDPGNGAGAWNSITLKRWQAIVDASPLYEGWYPSSTPRRA